MYAISPFRWISQYYFGFFFVYGVYLPFWSVWLKSQGFSPSDIGIIIGVAFASRCLSNLVITPRINRFDWLVPALRWLSLFSMVFIGLHGVTHSNFVLVLVVTVGFNLCCGSNIPVSDLVANYYSRKKLIDYGKARLWGSLAFIVSSTLVGWLVTENSAQVILWVAFVGSLILFVISTRVPMPKLESATGSQRAKTSMIHLLRDPLVLKFIFLVAFIQGSHAAYYGFSLLYWKSVGYSEGTIGYLWSLGVVAEVIIFGVSKSLFSKWTLRGMFALASVAVMVRWGLMAVTYELIVLIFVQLLHSITFAVAHIAATRYIQASPAENMVPLQALYNAIPLGGMMALMTSVSGWGYDLVGGKIFFGMAAMGLIALFIKVDSVKTTSQKELAAN